MILNNYWKWLNICQTTKAYNDDYNAPVYNIGIIDTTGNKKPISPNDSSSGWSEANHWCRNFAIGSILFGSGNDDISATDYSMSNDCTSSVGNVNYNVTSSANDDGFSRTITITGYNNSGSELTITEVGYAKSLFWHDRDLGNQYYSALFCKTKLNEPLTLPVGGNFLINLAWTEK